MANPVSSAPVHELVLTRFIDATPHALYRGWTEPALLVKWFVPPPWSVASAHIELRPGGAFDSVFRDPEGNEHPNFGVILEAVPDRKLVFTDAFSTGWRPTGRAFMVATVTFEPENGGTRYTARILHWSEADRQEHETMGFHVGWGIAADQLAALAKTF